MQQCSTGKRQLSRLCFLHTWSNHQKKQNSASVEGFGIWPAKQFGPPLLTMLSGQRNERMNERERASITLLFIKIRGHRQNEKDADKSKGLSTWITIVIYLLKPGCLLSIKRHHIPHLRRKASVIASHTNQHNLCNYALKVTLEAESDVSSLDSVDISDSSGDFKSRCEKRATHRPKFPCSPILHTNVTQMVNQAEIITKWNSSEC